ncbi:MAG: DUF547 domain-containing protein [Chitinispirillaceae bacterium]
MRVKKGVFYLFICVLFFYSESTFCSDPDYDSYAMVLRLYVNSRGWVDYHMLQLDREPLDKFVQSLGDVRRTDYELWDKWRKMAFLINAYNACVLQTVIDNYPVRPGVLFTFLHPINSIKQISGAFGGKRFSMVGENMSLNQIEQMLEDGFQEPRFRFALAKASRTCPPLRREIYSGAMLDYQLDSQIRRIVNSYLHYRIDPSGKLVYVSAVFRKVASESRYYHGEDQQKVVLFLSSYLSDFDRKLILNEGYQICFLRQNWKLNCWR